MTTRGEEYDARFARLAAEGAYLHGEADLVDDLLGGPPGRILDAGCGTGRVAIELARRGYDLVGIDVDPAMLDQARAKSAGAPGDGGPGGAVTGHHVDWRLGDLSADSVPETAFDLVVAAGNVLIFVQLGTEAAVVRALADALVPGGRLVAGFQLGRQLPLARYDQLAADVGLVLEDRWATWQRDPFRDGDYAVSVHRRPD